jgi:hypothetical protein
VGRDEVVYAETTHPDDAVPTVSWALDGRRLDDSDEDVDLGSVELTPADHTLTATSGGQTLTWTVDDSLPTTDYELSEPLVKAGDTYVFNGPFTMRLTGKDARPGYIVRESRVDGDGWFNYFGWPTSADLPWTFSENGTTIDSLTYGALPRGRHTIEYRSIDAAGNYGRAKSFAVTTLAPPPACTTTITGSRKGAIWVTSGVTCLNNAEISGAVTVRPGASLVVNGGTITGGLTASAAAQVHLLKTHVEGSVAVSGTTGALVIAGSEIRGAVSLSGNTTRDAAVVTGTSIHGSLSCAGNTPALSNAGVANDLTGADAQCGGLVGTSAPKSRTLSYDAVSPGLTPEDGQAEQHD